MRRCVTIGGGPIGDYTRVKSYLREEDFIICCDSGLKHGPGLGVTPDLIVGDFDSWENPGLPVETIALPREKDDTDTVFGVKEAVRRGFDDFLLLGVTGARLDHTLGNLSILLWLDALGKRAMAVDDFGEFQIVSLSPAWISEEFSYFSLLNITGLAKGITIQNAKYPLTGAEITSDYQYGISNEVLPGQRAQVSVQEGRLLLMRVF